jgi:hypothetical protein
VPAAHSPQFDLGVPVHWLTAELKRHLTRVTAPAHDPTDPPAFEAQAAHLERHGLFLRGERRRLTAEDFAPERVELADRLH